MDRQGHDQRKASTLGPASRMPCLAKIELHLAFRFSLKTSQAHFPQPLMSDWLTSSTRTPIRPGPSHVLSTPWGYWAWEVT